jgi:hypothetical protein
VHVGVLTTLLGQDLDFEIVVDVDDTPDPRSAAFFASRFCRKLPPVPRRVTIPSSMETAIALLSIFAFQQSSSATFRSSSALVVVLPR